MIAAKSASKAGFAARMRRGPSSRPPHFVITTFTFAAGDYGFDPLRLGTNPGPCSRPSQCTLQYTLNKHIHRSRRLWL